MGERLQPGVTRVPDGEPGDRANWVLTQADHFLKNSTLEVVDNRAKVRPGATVSFGALDYHSIAAESYAEFKNAREDGVLKADSRFLISIPTPFNAVNSFVEFDSQVEVAYAYEQQLRRSVDALQEVIPPSDLAIQWDLPTELATIEGWFPNPYGGVEPIFAATARLAHWIHDDAELTFHLCYGDSKFGASPFMGDPRVRRRPPVAAEHPWRAALRGSVTWPTDCPEHVQRRIDCDPGRDRRVVDKAGPLAAAGRPRTGGRHRGLPRAAARRRRWCRRRPRPCCGGCGVSSGIRHLHRVWARQTFSGTTGSRPGRVAGVHHRARTSARHRIARGLT